MDLDTVITALEPVTSQLATLDASDWWQLASVLILSVLGTRAIVGPRRER